MLAVSRAGHESRVLAARDLHCVLPMLRPACTQERSNLVILPLYSYLQLQAVLVYPFVTSGVD